MKKKTVRRRKSKPSSKPRVYSKTGQAAQTANQVTWRLLGDLKRLQRSYLRIGELLVRVRDEKLYSALDYPDILTYAENRLHLGQASLYHYIQVYDWAKKSHPEWLGEKVKGHIPELSDATDLMWIEEELSSKKLSRDKRASLEVLKQKAMDGRLRAGELNKWRKTISGSKIQSLKSFLSKFRTLRRRCAQVKCVPSEAISHVDSAIEIINNALSLQKNGQDLDETAK
mgnify:CR=1 FL=1